MLSYVANGSDVKRKTTQRTNTNKTAKLLLIRYSGHEDTVRENVVPKITNSNNSERKRPKER